MTEATRLLARGDRPSVEAIARAAGVSKATFYRAFPSRAGLFDELKLEPEPGTRRRIVDAAFRLLQSQTLAEMSMDEVAGAAHVSRANLYRLYPGKAALFQALIVEYSPFEPVMALFEQMGDRPPLELIPRLALTAYRSVVGRSGVARTLLLEITSMTPETQQAFSETGLRAFVRLAGYLQAQMAAGTLRQMNPILALQSLVGSVMMHVLSAAVLGVGLAPIPTGEDAVLELARLWLRGMRPEVRT